ncbi:MAG: alpha/beta fold hydrolase [Leptospiraceae bacterium]|nr:alpha/beta fold hydrolase [Leptospiraceae bacterium]MCP5493836.1 alpha/beta fold hydrolase [Leptospiraceae bacterium]
MIKPPSILKNPFVQSFLASKAFPFCEIDSLPSNLYIVDGGKNVRLVSYVSKIEEKKAKGVWIILHGWGGSSDSAYVVRSAQFFYQQGYDIVRLNFRDHGNTHGMNRDPFNGTLLEEAYQAVLQISLMYKNTPVYLLGFSLGGNFALRIAIRHSISKEKIYNLQYCFAISPSINPKAATEKIDSHFFLKKSFLSDWIDSLQKKRKHFPNLFDAKMLKSSQSVMELTEQLVLQCTNYTSLDEYFSKYTLTGNAFQKLSIPSIIITSLDDPVVPAKDFAKIKANKNLHFFIREYGGHNGFFLSWNLQPWYNPFLLSIITSGRNLSDFL